MKRWFLEIAYDGKAYHGWQVQNNANTVQEEIQNALTTTCGEEIEVVGCGRTDTGVHAKQFFLHFDTEHVVEKRMLDSLNGLLASDISAREIMEVENDAHARFDATSRTYQYHIVSRKNPFFNGRAYFLKRDIDLDQMNLAAEILITTKDFASFCKAGSDVKTTICDVKEAYWEANDELVTFTISADRFLRNMVRAVVGTLLQVGLSKLNVNQFQEIIDSKSRSNAGSSVPAHGLYLTQVKYPSTIFKN